jgi:hypothetical protein
MFSILRRRPVPHAERARRIATSIDRVRRQAREPSRLQPPLFHAAVVRAADRDLAATAALLRHATPTPQALARVERLLTDPHSPLYGPDPSRLRTALRGA